MYKIKKKTIYKYEYGIISKSVYVYHENVHKYDLCFVLFAISLKLYNPPVFVMYIFFFGLKAAIAYFYPESLYTWLLEVLPTWDNAFGVCCSAYCVQH